MGSAASRRGFCQGASGHPELSPDADSGLSVDSGAVTRARQGPTVNWGSACMTCGSVSRTENVLECEVLTQFLLCPVAHACSVLLFYPACRLQESRSGDISVRLVVVCASSCKALGLIAPTKALRGACGVWWELRLGPVPLWTGHSRLGGGQVLGRWGSWRRDGPASSLDGGFPDESLLSTC